MSRQICVTGGAGMIGSRLVRALLEAGHDVTVIDNLWRGQLHYLTSLDGFDLDAMFHQIDLSDPENASRTRDVLDGCDSVVHLADIVAGIGYVFNNQYEIFRVNNLINTHVLRACADIGVPRVLYAGTACSFPRHLQMSLGSVLVESQLFPAEPESAYGWSKLMGTLELQFMTEQHGITASTLMLHNVYGPNCDVEPARSQVIPSLIRRMIELEEGATLSVWGSGQQGRAFVHVDDIARAFVSALDCPAAELVPVIQIGPGHCTSIRDLVDILRDRVIRKDLVIDYDRTKPEGDLGRCADFSLAQRILGWSPQVDLEVGLTDTYNWIEAELRARI